MNATIDDIRTELSRYGDKTPEYWHKQMHRLPDASVVNRQQFIVERCRGKRVLDVGASGVLHDAIDQAASRCYGIDKDYRPGVKVLDLDECGEAWPEFENVEIVVCGEVLEHLSNPGNLLARIRRSHNCPLIATVPNAYSRIAQLHLRSGYENVNRDHVAWHSPQTLKVLLARAGYEVREWYGYNGQWPTCEGIIAVAE